MTERTGALASMAATPRLLRALLEHVPPEAAEGAADGDWSPRDLVAHLIVSERLGAASRIRRIVDEERPTLAAYDEGEALERSGLRSERVAALLDRFERERREDLAWMRALGDREWSRTGVHSEVGDVTAEELLYHLAHHDLAHVAQLAEMLRLRFEPLRGALRAF